MDPNKIVNPPPFTDHVWGWFHELHRSRGVGFNGALPITYADIANWSSITGESPRPWELAAIQMMDDRFLNGPKQVAPAHNTRPMTLKLFDALFAPKK